MDILSTQLGLDTIGRLFLGFSALIWLFFLATPGAGRGELLHLLGTHIMARGTARKKKP